MLTKEDRAIRNRIYRKSARAGQLAAHWMDDGVTRVLVNAREGVANRVRQNITGCRVR